ncbi:BON domain-containing protein [bacterium]|nr:BON domain-containing protein [bacterium]
MRYQLTLCLICTAALCLSADDVLAQSSSLFGSSGPQSQSNIGGVRSGTQSGGYGGGTQTNATLNAASAFLPAEGLVNTTSPTGQTGGFVGRNTTGTFVGQQQAGQQQNQAGRSGLNSLSNQFGRQGAQQFQNTPQGTGNADAPQVRYQQKIAFPYRSIAAPEVTNALQGRFQRLSERNDQLAGLSVQWAGDGTVTLYGTVPDERTRRLAESLTRLEPGVRRVDNQLEVAIP